MARERLTADGDALRRIRNDAWLDQIELAEMTGLTPHTIMRIELGHTPHPNRSTIKKIAKALGVHPSALTKEGDSDAPLGHFSFGRVRTAGLVGVG